MSKKGDLPRPPQGSLNMRIKKVACQSQWALLLSLYQGWGEEVKAVVLCFPDCWAVEILPWLGLLILNACFLIQCLFQMNMLFLFSGACTFPPPSIMLPQFEIMYSLWQTANFWIFKNKMVFQDFSTTQIHLQYALLFSDGNESKSNVFCYCYESH